MASRLAPDLILHGGNIATMDDTNRFVHALAARNGSIAAIGSSKEINELAGPDTVTIDLEGRTAIPGIVDSHAHPDTYAARLATWEEVSPDKIGSTEALLQRISDLASARGPDDWIACYRYDDIRSGGYPDLASLDAAADGRPLYIQRTDGHLCLANSRAFAEVGLGTDPADPAFGSFDRDPQTDALTGLCRETAAEIFTAFVHRNDTPESLADGLEKVFAEWRALGITSVYNSLCGRRSIEAYQQLKATERLGMRVGVIVSGREAGLIESYIQAGIRSGFGDDWLRIIGVEWCPDCSTSGRTAAYYEPYIGEPVPGEPEPNTGMLLYDRDDLASRAVAAHRAGLQVMIEGVGDRGIDFALDAIEACLEAEPRDDHRMRVEHCCYVTPPILERLKRLEVIDSSATGFMHDLGSAYVANRGQEAMRHMWPHRSLIDNGVPAPGHSDAMVCQANPFTALWSMVTRRSGTGADLDECEKVSRTEALRAYTTLGAYSGREEAIKGSLEVGKLADIAILDRDYFSCPEEEIRKIRVESTVLNGDITYHL
ncbi:MAG: amidohydrolase [Pseudomonadota bacterium]